MQRGYTVGGALTMVETRERRAMMLCEMLMGGERV